MNLAAVIVGGVIPGVFLLAGGVLTWWLRRKPEELSTMGKLLADIGKLRDRIATQDVRIEGLTKAGEQEREMNARWRFHAMRYIERLVTQADRQNRTLAGAGLPVDPVEALPDELKTPPTGA